MVLIPLVLAVLYVGGPAWVAAITVLAAIGGREMEAMALAGDLRPMRRLAPAGAAGVVAAAGFFGSGAALGALTAVVMLAFADQLRRDDVQRSLADWAFGVGSTAYVGLLLAYLAMLRGLPGGLRWTGALVLLVWANDSGAYVGGRIFGSRPMAPTISPNKTWEGFAAGTAASVAAGAALWAAIRLSSWPPPVFFTNPPPFSPSPYLGLWVACGVGLMVAVAGPLGDLAKSFIKRRVGVKDTGHLIPGHGGVLDRMDSLMFAAPAVYTVATLLGRVHY